MGGWGSGRWQRGKKTTNEQFALDVRNLQRKDLLAQGRRGTVTWSRCGEETDSIQIRSAPGRVILKYRARSGDGEWYAMEYPLSIEWTDCYLGGRRPWFLCPASGCGRRVAILFGGAMFVCRHCHQLVYASQRERTEERASRRAEVIRDRLGWAPGILNATGEKPKGMHWTTFARLQARHDVLVNQTMAGALAKFGPLRELLFD